MGPGADGPRLTRDDEPSPPDGFHGRAARPGRGDVASPEDPDRPRLFYAIPLPDPVREAIRPVRDAVQAAVGDGNARIRWVRIESLHLTLRFLGPTSLDRAPELGAIGDVVAAGAGRFEVVLAGAGAFPSPARPRTVWLGLRNGAEALTRLASALESATGGGEGRPFAAHLTLARTDGLRAAPQAARALVAAVGDRSWSFEADRIVLFRSHLGRGPAWYEPLHASPLR